MVPLLNTFNLDCSVAGNHDFGAFLFVFLCPLPSSNSLNRARRETLLTFVLCPLTLDIQITPTLILLRSSRTATFLVSSFSQATLPVEARTELSTRLFSFVFFSHFSSLSGLLSNIHDSNTSKVPEPLLEYLILPRKGLNIGIIGLVESFVP